MPHKSPTAQIEKPHRRSSRPPSLVAHHGSGEEARNMRDPRDFVEGQERMSDARLASGIARRAARASETKEARQASTRRPRFPQRDGVNRFGAWELGYDPHEEAAADRSEGGGGLVWGVGLRAREAAEEDEQSWVLDLREMKIEELDDQESGLGCKEEDDGVYEKQMMQLQIVRVDAKRALVGVGARILFYPTLFYNVFRNKIQAEFRWWDEVDQYLLLGAVPFPKDVPRLKKLGVGGVITLNEPYETLVPSALYRVGYFLPYKCSIYACASM
ncbi:unnamed protein product [Linum tenue]|uniref:Dual specificity protein phosphatase DSP8 n=1 Tax=Linum tenue TaxID=586396 RepID=A0AAV0KU36_9ROSI|nr:unnamed protein product [Linum tenue]